ncbi:EamA family transporter [Altericroceibacterium spongiae]|uniref:EamA family transporter n=1 Tax=Altericroceibacterium spongiae TaxID=2320269 RepID=A0A420EBZ5_9SPHN|nr:EamA family transporter [Altericroceibacterium spongiae]RKF18196.1 EamA family transporter [Altericroceibacterium spongiae]
MNKAQENGAGSSLVPVAVLICAMLSIACGVTLAKQLFPAVGAQGTTTLRLFFAAIMLAAVLRPWRVRFSRFNWKPVLFYGLAMGGMNLLFYMSLRTLPLGVALALEFSGPLTVAICSSRRVLDFVWVGCAAIGLLILLPIGRDMAGVDPTGAAFALGAGVCWALYILTGRRAGHDHGAMAASLGMIVAAILVLPVGIAHAGTKLLDLPVLGIAVAVGLLSSALPYSLEMYTLRRLPPQTFGTLTSLEPAIGALIGLILMGERLPLLHWGAIGLIICASIGVTLSDIKARNRVKRTELLPE